nr:L-type lectin-domain containing receptor kinase IX.1-like [Tanacetum cinerariifolium]GFA24233.1 L-type lectin-domain containing receptor kinase IX.1-like [Tanacetum cinerariifolium]
MNSNGLRLYGDGLTFFLAQNNTVFTPGGAMGLPTNYSNVISPYRFVAVEFDTFWNVWDPLDSSNTSIGDHVGISISSLNSVTYQKWLSNVSGGGVCQAWITYDSVSKILSVNFTGYQNYRVIRQNGLDYVVDLRKELPEWVIFGFSAGTGALFQKNDVRSWSFDGSDLEVDKRNEQPPNLQIPSPDPVIRDNINVGLIIGVPVSVTILGFLLYILWSMRKKKSNAEEAEKIGFDVGMNNKFEKGTGSKRFSYNELARSTCDFAETEKLGEGGFGGVYRDLEEEHIKRLMIVGLWCVYPDSEHRPSIRQAIQALKSEVSLPTLPPKMPVATYWTPSIVQNEPPSVISNRDSSNQSVLIGR